MKRELSERGRRKEEMETYQREGEDRGEEELRGGRRWRRRPEGFRKLKSEEEKERKGQLELDARVECKEEEITNRE